MNQQINLYQPIFRRTKAILSSTTLAQIGLLMITGLILIYTFAWWRVENAEQQVAQLEKEQAQYLKNIEKLDQAIPLKRESKLIAQRLEQKHFERKTKSEILTTLTQQTNTHAYSFSNLMSGLGRQRIQGLWLKRIFIGDGGDQIDLSGSALTPDLVPQLLQQLKREKSFEGRVFRHFKVNRDTQRSPYLDFSLRTSEPMADK